MDLRNFGPEFPLRWPCRKIDGRLQPGDFIPLLPDALGPGLMFVVHGCSTDVAVELRKLEHVESTGNCFPDNFVFWIPLDARSVQRFHEVYETEPTPGVGIGFEVCSPTEMLMSWWDWNEPLFSASVDLQTLQALVKKSGGQLSDEIQPRA